MIGSLNNISLGVHTHTNVGVHPASINTPPPTHTGGRPKAYVQYGFGPPVEAAVTDLGNGKYTLRFVPPNEGECGKMAVRCGSVVKYIHTALMCEEF